MRIERIKISRFKAHSSSDILFQKGINVIYGPNAIGKTNVLEAIHIGMLTKNFLPTTDADSLRFNEEHFEIDVFFQTDIGIEKTSRVFYAADSEQKSFFINGSRLDRFSAAIGQLPCVVLSPLDSVVVHGNPEDRRKMLDLVISQYDKSYLNDILNYKKVLLQRNKLLSDIKNTYQFTQENKKVLDAWTETLAALGSSIIRERLNFIYNFLPMMEDVYKKFDHVDEKPSIKYVFSLLKGLDAKSTKYLIYNELVEQFERRREEELKRGFTVLGPHRDDILFELNDISVKRFASQGQVKTFITCLKAAQREYIYDKSSEMPVFLLDEALDKLDHERAENLLSFLSEKGQIFITHTEKINTDIQVEQINIENVLQKST